MAGLRAGRQDAFEALYESYRERIFNLALRIVQSREDAGDITQDVFLKAFRQMPTGDDLSVKPWLYRVAVNTCYDHLRARRLHRTIDDAQHDTRAPHIDTFEQAELGRQFEQTLARLSERQRTVLVLKDVHGLRHDEIASILGVSRNAAETLLFRARASFRQEYAALSHEQPQAGCGMAREASGAAIAGDLPSGERARIVAHARTCPECRETVKSWGVAAIGLGLFLHSAPLPASLQAPLALGSGAATAAAGGASAAAGGEAAGVGASAGLAASGGSAGLTAVAGGGLAKIGGALTAKVLIAVVPTSCAVTAAGVTVHRVDLARHQHAAAAAAQRSETKGGVAESGGGRANGGQSGTHGNSAAAQANKLAKPAKPAKPSKPAPTPKPTPAPKPGKTVTPGPKG